MQKAFVTGILIAVACSLLGTFLVLRRLSLIGDGLAHISFGGVAFGLLFNIVPFFGALFFAIIGAFGIQKLRKHALLFGDTAIGLVSSVSLGLGVFIASVARGFNVDILSYLFGSILSIRTSELLGSVVLAFIVILFIIIYYRDLFYLSFDEDSARVSGVKVDFLSSLLILLTAFTVVSSMGVVGLMLASSMLILPPASALQFKQSFRNTLLISVFVGIVSVISGLLVAYYFDFAASGTIVLVNALIFGLCFLIKRKY